MFWSIIWTNSLYLVSGSLESIIQHSKPSVSTVNDYNPIDSADLTAISIVFLPNAVIADEIRESNIGLDTYPVTPKRVLPQVLAVFSWAILPDAFPSFFLTIHSLTSSAIKDFLLKSK